jgi:hypothetical protein
MSYQSRIAAIFAAILSVASVVDGDPLNCSLTGYKAVPGLAAAVSGETLELTWDGVKNQELRLRLTNAGATPTVRELAVRTKGGAWATLATNVTPEFRIASGLRRATLQQIKPLRDLGVEITPEVLDRIKWEAFWDAPLNVPGGDAAHGDSTPPLEGIANQPGLPRKPEEVKRVTATYQATSCTVTTNGGRIEVSFPGAQAGVFTGRLQYTVYKGTNLIRQELVAKTEEKSVAYKYEAGFTGLAIRPSSRAVWRDSSNQWQDYQFGGAKNAAAVPLIAANRVLAVEAPGGAIATFPPPHNFFWSRETEVNLGYVWYRKDSDTTFSFGVRQADSEAEPSVAGRGPEDTRQNFALYSARPGTWQRMPVYFYVSTEPGQATLQAALAFTRDDHYKPLPGYQVMATHFHTSPVPRARALGGLDVKLPDFEVMKAAGVNIFAPIGGGGGGFGGGENGGGRGAGGGRAGGAGGGGRGGANPGARLQALADYYEIARRHSDKNFLIMPNHELMSTGLGGHLDFLLSKPVFWTEDRQAGQPLVEEQPNYGRVYRLNGPADFMEMARRENILIYMPHPRSKGSTGYPDAVKDKDWFKDEHYRGIGYRWGMGLDGSETRLCDYRCLALFDDMNNWVADVPTPPKYIQAISETYRKGPGDDIYANNPVNYVKLDRVPQPDDMSSVINAMKRGDYFVTSGEVLISSYAVEGSGANRTVSAEVEWTFPLEFVEVVWGDGKKTDRQIIPATDLAPFGKHRFRIPFNAEGKKWVRFAVWDSAGNGALVQPIKLAGPTTTTASPQN